MYFSVDLFHDNDFLSGSVNRVQVNPVNYMYSSLGQQVLLCIRPQRSDTAQLHKAFNQCCFNVGQRRRRWHNIETVLGECLLFAGLGLHHISTDL